MDQETWKFINSFAPWLSAMGTLVAVVVALYLSQRDRRIHLKVRASLRVRLVRGGGLGGGARFVSVNISNIGRRATSVTGLGFKFPTACRGEVLPPLPEGSALPVKLEDGDEAAYLYPLEAFCDGIFAVVPPKSFMPAPSIRLRLARCIVATSHRRAFLVPFTGDLRQELADRVRILVRPQAGRPG